MSIEKQNNLSKAEQTVFDRLKKRWVLEKYEQRWYKVWENIWWFKSKKTHNINFYTNNKWELLFFVFWLKKGLWEKYNKYLAKLWYKEIKDNIWYYHMINIKTGEETPQESLEYYKIFETLWNIQYREYLSDVIYEGWLKKEWEKLKKMPNLQEQMDEIIFPELENMSNFYVLKPFELILFNQYWIINKEHFNKLKKKVYTFEYIKKLIENPVWNYVEWETKEYKINWKTYKIKTNWITEDELKLYLDLKIINKEDYEVLKTMLEKQKLEQEEKEHINQTKKHISSLGDDVKDKIA